MGGGALLNGGEPYHGKDAYAYAHGPGWRLLSKPLRELLAGLLQPQPSLRWTLAEALEHPWTQGGGPSPVLGRRNLGQGLGPRLGAEDTDEEEDEDEDDDEAAVEVGDAQHAVERAPLRREPWRQRLERLWARHEMAQALSCLHSVALLDSPVGRLVSLNGHGHRGR